MKIIQSFWSKPFIQPHNKTFHSRLMGGFPLKRYFIYTWALSVLRLKEAFSEVHLITDDFGKYLLFDLFKLPYKSVSIDLNELKTFSTRFWAAGKLHTFSKIDCPFLHFDGDTILGSTFDTNLTDHDLIAEFEYEDKTNMYRLAIESIYKNLEVIIPSYIREKITDKTFIYKDYNMGIIGGRNYKFFNEYGLDSLSLIINNSNALLNDDGMTSFLNCFFEQFMFHNRVNKEKMLIHLCIPEKINHNFDYQSIFLKEKINHFNFVHLHNFYKLTHYTTTESWLKYYYPSVYNKINSIIFSNK